MSANPCVSRPREVLGVDSPWRSDDERLGNLTWPGNQRLLVRPQTTDSGSNFCPVGPTWISVPISGHTPQS
jgi:hypothetical protein